MIVMGATRVVAAAVDFDIREYRRPETGVRRDSRSRFISLARALGARSTEA
jgi:hypothetical protein